MSLASFTDRLGWRERQRLLATRRWKRLRLQVLDAANWRCSKCGNYGNEVHHVRREASLFWTPSNLRPLCTRCHIRLHQNERRESEFYRKRAKWRKFTEELA